MNTDADADADKSLVSDGHNSDNKSKDDDSKVSCEKVGVTTLDDDNSSDINESDDKVCDIKASDTEVVITHGNKGEDNVDDDTDKSDEELILNLESPSELLTSVSHQTLPVQDQQSLVTHKH